MLRTFGSELTSLINSVPAWKVSKGSRSASRRARKTVDKSPNNRLGVICRSSEGSNMPVSESEKHGVSMLGCRFSEKAEHVPIKKRRFLLRTPSPPPQPASPPRSIVSSPPTEEIEDHLKSQDASNKLVAKGTASADINSSQITGNNIVNHDEKSENANEKHREVEDFSGMSILAAAACSSSLGRDCGYSEDRSCVEECSTQEQARELCTSVEEHSSSRGLLKEDFVNSSEISTGGTSSCVSTEPVGELVSFSTTVNLSQNVETVGKVIKGASSGAACLTLPSDVACSKDEETVGNQRPASRDDRLHWDLNVVMDAWELPFEDPDVQNEVQGKKSQDGEKHKHDDQRLSFEGHADASQDKLATTCGEQDYMLPFEPRTSTGQSLEGKEGNHDVDACHSVPQAVRSDVKSLLSKCNNNMDSVKCKIEDDQFYMPHHEAVNTDGSALAASDHASQPSAYGNIKKEDDSVQSLKLCSAGDNNSRSTLEGLSSHAGATSSKLDVCASDTPCGNASADIQATLHVSYGQDIRREVTPNLTIMENLGTSLGLLDNGNAVIEKVDFETSESLEHSPVVKSNDKGLAHSSCAEAPKSASTKCEVAVVLDTTQMQAVSDPQGRKLVCNNETSSNAAEIDPVIKKEMCDFVCHDTCKANVDSNMIFSDKIGTAEPHVHCDNVDTNCHTVSVVGVNTTSEIQEGYDSQYEDGELRETNECTWGEYYVDREAEHVDYGQDDMEIFTTSPTCYYVSESQQVEEKGNAGLEVVPIISSSVCNFDNEVSAKAAENVRFDETCDKDNKIKQSHSAEEKMKAPLSKDLLESSKSSSDMATGVIDNNGRNDAMSSHGGGLADFRGTETRMESKAFRRGLRSQIEGPFAHDVSSREDRLNKLESRYEESSSMRSFERVRYPFHNQGRGRQGHNWDGSFDGRRGIKRHYSPVLHGHSKLDDDGIIERDDIRRVDMQNGASYSHHVLQKSRSGIDEDAYAGFHSHCKPDRKFSPPDRAVTFGRGRSFRYGPSVDSRGVGRGRYNDPSPDESFQSSLKYRRPLSRRERSISPFGVRGNSDAHHSRGKSPSRSRSRSPITWQQQRGKPGAGSGGNTFLRHRNRSPNFRPEVRVQRHRSPHHQPGFGGDQTMGFRSFQREHSCPTRGRWNSARKDDPCHFREFGYKQRASGLERSPGRIRMRGDSPRNMKPEGYYRISEDGAGRGLRYENNNYEDRRKPYGPLHLTRRTYEDRHLDIDDSFQANNIRDRDASNFPGRGLRGVDCRIGDLPRRLRGEQHSFMYERGGKFNSNSKQFGVDVMDSSRNLQSEEQYRSTHSGRFSELDGPRRRYENYEERRKQYGGVTRRIEMEATEKRLNHNVDENFQDAPDFRGRGLRNFDGRIGSVSTRLGEDQIQNPAVCGQEEKVDDNPHSIGAQNSNDNDTTK